MSLNPDCHGRRTVTGHEKTRDSWGHVLAFSLTTVGLLHDEEKMVQPRQTIPGSKFLPEGHEVCTTIKARRKSILFSIRRLFFKHGDH